MVWEVIDMLRANVYAFAFIQNRLTNQPPVMTYFSNKDNQASTELLPVSAKKLFVPSSASVTTTSSSNGRPLIPFSQFTD